MHNNKTLTGLQVYSLIQTHKECGDVKHVCKGLESGETKRDKNKH